MDEISNRPSDERSLAEGEAPPRPAFPARMPAAPIPSKGVAPPAAKAKLKTSLEMVAGHWCQPSVGVEVPPSLFYDLTTKAVMDRNLPGVEFARVFWKEEAFVGAKREYLRVQRARIVFDICAAPQGAGSFFSSWLCIVPFQISAAHLAGILTGTIVLIWLIPVALIYMIALAASTSLWWWVSRAATTTSFKDDFLLGLTGIGPIAKFLAELKPTYYQIDSAIIFQSAVQEATLAVIDSLCEAGKVPLLSDAERKPILREFMKK